MKWGDKMEVVFDDSAKAGLLTAMRCNRGFSKAAGGDVAGISFLLDVGDISGEVTGTARTQAIWRQYGHAFTSPQDASFLRFIHSIADDLARVCEAAKHGERIRVWHADAPKDACGLRHLLWEIRDCECPVSEVVRHASWANAEPEAFCRALYEERAIAPTMQSTLAVEWQALVRENAPLRAMVNGVLVGVEEDFYDEFLHRCMPKGEFLMARWIGTVLNRYDFGVGDGWYARRIRKMIEEGEVETVGAGDDDYPYSIWLRKK